VSTTQVEVASLCPGQETQVLELSQLSADQTLYAFYEKVNSTFQNHPIYVSSFILIGNINIFSSKYHLAS